jgi:predicted metal-dependent hydrolase
MPEASTLEVRNLSFSFDEDVPRYWHGGRRSVTAFFDNLSIFFPAGEKFFVASVKAHKHLVTDPVLLEQVKAFCAQEGVHRREHAHYDAMIERHGWPAAQMERRVERLLARVSRVLPRRWQLAATCALEHFTALMAHFLLADPRLLEGAHPVMASLWRWHAAEESEHKAVAFDEYVAAGGNHVERCAVMAVATVIFWAKVVEHQVRMMHADGILFSASEWSALVRFLFVEPGGMLQLVGPYLRYYRPGFHPWELDTSDLLEAFRAELASSPVYREAAA